MDSLTQIVLGAAVGEAVLGKKVGNKAMLWGAIAGTIPDLDVVNKLFFDSVTANELHRGFSHSIMFSLIFAPIFGWLIFKLYKGKKASWKGWTQLMFWGLFTHPLLDMHTSWGTQLLWPLEYKFSYNNIFVVDPMYTVPFLFFLIFAMIQKRGTVKRERLNRMGLIVSSAYMLLTIVFKGITYFVFKESLKEQEVEYIAMETKPTPLNSILWTANVETKDSFLIGYYSLLDKDKNISWRSFEKDHDLLGAYKTDPLIQRLATLSHDWYTIEKKDGVLYFNDLRFGLMGISPVEDRFVFSYKLNIENGMLTAEETEKNTSEAGPLLSKLFHRVLGNK
ncbi:metal-dependent hydrolase [Flavicella sp.]|uniref:metal-dependent hydrolase n=1 Tax=Flavicella sp. TaxID=2957742 RepID=UPI002629169F|nr:metal-dependent hydrolase [Flavicella sp.]MDG1804886.1 metal-dependent hydrolase [Flavicella sp.]